MATIEVTRSDRPVGLDASTLCEAFQLTAAAHPERVALRTKGGEFELTWGEYADKVRRVAAGFASLGLGADRTLGVMLTNRPEFHFADTAAMHLGAIPFSIYNTYSPEQIEYLVGDAECPIIVTEQVFLDRIVEVQKACSSLKHVVVVDGDAADGVLTLDDVARRSEGGFDFDASWRAVKPDDILTLIYTSGTTGPPKGVQLTHDNLIQAVRSFDQIIALPRRRPRGVVPADGAHRRAQLLALPADDARLHRHLLPEPARGDRLPARGAAHLVLRRAPHLGEAQGRARGGHGRRAGRGAQARDPVGLRRRACARCGSSRPGRSCRRELLEEYAKADEMVLSKVRAHARARRARVAQRGRRAHAARGDRVLPRARPAAGGAVGHVRDHAAPGRATRRAGQDRHGRPARAGHRDQARRRRRGADPRAGGDAGLPQRARQDAPRRSTPTAGCTRATSASSTRTAISRSSTARRS